MIGRAQWVLDYARYQSGRRTMSPMTARAPASDGQKDSRRREDYNSVLKAPDASTDA